MRTKGPAQAELLIGRDGEAGMSEPVGTPNSTAPQCLVFEHTDALDSTLAEFVAQRLNEGVEERGAATLVVSGGSTPLGFRCLAGIEMPWPKIQIVLADERWVPIDHPDSNEGQLRMDISLPALASLLSLRGEADTPKQQVYLNQQLRGQCALRSRHTGYGK